MKYLYMVIATFFVTDDSYWQILGFWSDRVAAQDARLDFLRKPQSCHVDVNIIEVNADTLDYGWL